MSSATTPNSEDHLAKGHDKVMETPVADVHRAGGARMGVWFGCALPDNFGDAREEQRYANQSVALIDKNYRAYFALNGPDRVRYLNAILTNDVKGLKENQANLSLLLTPQGRILAEIETRADAEQLFCTTHAMARPAVAAWLEKYIIMDDVTLTDETERFATIGLEGPAAPKIVRSTANVDLVALQELQSVACVADGVACRVQRRAPSTRGPGAEFLMTRSDAVHLWTRLMKAARAEGGGPMGYEALSAQRLAQGVPWFGYDFGEKQIPHEAGLEQSHISYTKGCYTGQEIVERVRSRGQVNRRRVLLRITGEQTPVAGTPLTTDVTTGLATDDPASNVARNDNSARSDEVGFVTRAARSWFPAGIFAMAYVRKDFAAPGSLLRCGASPAEVVVPPLG